MELKTKPKTKKLKNSFQIQLERLPSDCVSKILNFLNNTRDFFSIRQSCKFFNNILNSTSFYKKHNRFFFNFKKFSFASVTEETKSLCSSSDDPLYFVRALKIKEIDCLDRNQFKIFSTWIHRFVNLHTLEIKDIGFYKSSKKKFFELFGEKGKWEHIGKKIESLTIHNAIYQIKGLNAFRNLRYLSFQIHSLSEVDGFDPTIFKQLEKIEIKYDIHVFRFGAKFEVLFGSISSLHTLVLTGFTNQIINMLKFSFFKTLKELHFKEKIKNDDDMHWDDDLPYSAIEEFNNNITEAPQEISKKIFQGMKNLEILRLPDFIEDLDVSDLKNLKEIEFRFKDKNSLSSLFPFLELSIPRIKINLVEFPFIILTEETFKRFKEIKTETKLKICSDECKRFYHTNEFSIRELKEKPDLNGIYLIDDRKVYTLHCPECIGNKKQTSQ